MEQLIADSNGTEIIELQLSGGKVNDLQVQKERDI